jgi:hypothetical protein
MLSTASRMNRWSDVRRVRRALALPFVGVFVGLFLTTTSVATRTPTPTPQAGASSVESSSPIFENANGLLHPSAAVFDSQRRHAPVTSDFHAAVAQAFRHRIDATISIASRRDFHRSSDVARGYDATAPPTRFRRT